MHTQKINSDIGDFTDPPSVLPLTIRNATARIPGKTLVGPLDLTIGKQGLTIVMGPNGSGKTTLLRLLHGLQRTTSGEVNWAVPTEIAQRRQAYVFQSPIMMRRTVLDCIAYPLTLRGTSKKDARIQARQWAEQFGMGALLPRPAKVLSGGEKQKLSLLRALIGRPDILFLDEPCANLDGNATREIEQIVKDTCTAGTRIVMATHDMGQARRLASDVIFMYGGRVHESGPAHTFFAGPRSPEAAGFINGDIVE